MSSFSSILNEFLLFQWIKSRSQRVNGNDGSGGLPFNLIYKSKTHPNYPLINFLYKRHSKSPKYLNLEFKKFYEFVSEDQILETAYTDSHFILISPSKASFYNTSDFTVEKSCKLPNLINYNQRNRTISPNCRWIAEELYVWELIRKKRYIFINSLIDGSLHNRIEYQDVYGLAFSSCSNYLAAGVLDNYLIIYKLKTKEIINKFRAYSSCISSIAWQKDYLFCWGVNDLIFNIWDTRSQILVYQSKEQELMTTKSRWSINCKYIIMGNCKSEILKFNCADHKMIKHQAFDTDINEVNWGHKDTYIIVSGNGILKIFGSKNFDVLYCYKSSYDIFGFTSISPNGDYLTYSLENRFIIFFKISPDGDYLRHCDEFDTLSIFDTS